MICHRVLDGLIDSSGEGTTTIYWMMITFETMTMLANSATKLTMTAGLFCIYTRMPMMTNATAQEIGGRTVYGVVNVQLIFAADIPPHRTGTPATYLP